MLLSVLLLVGGLAAMYVDWDHMGGLAMLGFVGFCCGLVQMGAWMERELR